MNKPIESDPWKHRSANMLCKTCMWFVPKLELRISPTHIDPLAEIGSGVGRCRRHAPSMGGYPVVMMNDWCGDHRLDENKVVTA